MSRVSSVVFVPAAPHRSAATLRGERGIALVLTLAVLAVLSILTIGFLVSMRTEQAAARNATYMTVARQMAQAAVDDAIYRMRATMPLLSPTNSFATMAGAAVTWPSAPAAGGNLFSVSSAGTIDLNADQVIVSASNSLYTTAANRQIVVNWINVGIDGLDGSNGTNLLGRYAFWTDDKASKLNVNSANQRASTDALGVTPAAVDLTVLPGVLPATATASYNYALTNGYFTAEQWQMTAGGAMGSLYQQNQFYITPYGIDADQTPWGSTKFNLNANFSTFQTEIDGGGTNTLNNPSLAGWFGTGHNFSEKYGGNVNLTKQILANMCDFRYSPSGVNNQCTGSQAGYLDATVAGTSGIPMYYLGLKLFPFLNEIAVIPTWSWTAGVGSSIQAQLWVFVELVNPYGQAWGTGGSIKVNVDKFFFRINSTTPSFAPYTAGQDGGLNQEIELPIGNVGANSYFVTNVVFTFGPVAQTDTNAYVDIAEVRLNKVRLLQTQGNDNTIRDWAQWYDLTNYFETSSTPIGSQPNHFIFIGTNRIAQSSVMPAIANTFLQGIAKNDPRVRTFTTWAPPLPAWYRVGDLDVSGNAAATILKNVTLGAENSTVNMSSGTGLSLANDPLPSVATTVANSPDFYMLTSTNDVPYQSIGQLGYIHTGLQWRTLSLLPYPTSELANNYIPDWTVLDLFSVTNAPLQGRININGYVTNLVSATTPKRVTPLLGLLTGITAANAMGSSTDQGMIASNIYNQVWAGSSCWATNRSIGPRTFMPGVFNMIGELCEIDNICTNWNPSTAYTSKFVAENRIRSFASLITTRSDTFSVWALGQALDPVSNVVAEAKVEAVVQRYEDHTTTPGTVKFHTLYFRYLTP